MGTNILIMNRQQRRMPDQRESNNRKGTHRIFLLGRKKFKRTKQLIGKKLIVHYNDVKPKRNKRKFIFPKGYVMAIDKKSATSKAIDKELI